MTDVKLQNWLHFLPKDEKETVRVNRFQFNFQLIFSCHSGSQVSHNGMEPPRAPAGNPNPVSISHIAMLMMCQDRFHSDGGQEVEMELQQLDQQ